MRKIAILILTHSNPNQLSRMIEVLGNKYFDYYVHVDKKVDIGPFRANCKSNTIFVEERINVQLIDYSLIEATMSLVKAAINSGVDYTYYALLTGSDYPIKSPNYIYQYLNTKYPISFIDMYSCNIGVEWTNKLGVKYYSQRLRNIIRDFSGDKLYYSPFGRLIRIIPRIYDNLMTHIKYSPREKIKKMSYEYSAGSHFWILPDIAIMHILSLYSNDSSLNTIFKHISAPEESYFQTVLSALDQLQLPEEYYDYSDEDRHMDQRCLRLIKWYENGIHTNGHPAIWIKNDFNYIRNSRALFARKFNSDKDSQILDLIDNEIIRC